MLSTPEVTQLINPSLSSSAILAARSEPKITTQGKG